MSSSDFDFASVLEAQNATIPAIQSYVRTAGFGASGDGGAALYKRAASMPAHAGRFQSADGAWWELCSADWNIKMFGAGLRGTDTADIQSCLDAAVVVSSVGREIYFPAGDYVITGTINIPSAAQAGLKLRGAGNGSTRLFRDSGF